MPRLLGISGSLRSASANSGLVRCAQAHAVKLDGVEWVTADIGSLPLYNQDLEDGCTPAEVAQFRQQVRPRMVSKQCRLPRRKDRSASEMIRTLLKASYRSKR